jgi:eight transmembrane protein EpsH (proposed exosortase)
VTVGWVALLITLCYFPVLQRLVVQWSSDEDMGHGFFVPVIAGYIVWQNRARLLALEWKTTPVGLVVILWSALQLMVGILGAELFLQRTALIECLAGIVLYVGGWTVLKALAFPLVLLVFMVPLPAVIYNQITFPLQLFASAVAEMMLSLMGIPVLREGNVLELASQKLSVVEACSGIRSLLSLSFLSLVYGHFFEKITPVRWLLFLGTIPHRDSGQLGARNHNRCAERSESRVCPRLLSQPRRLGHFYGRARFARHLPQNADVDLPRARPKGGACLNFCAAGPFRSSR